MVHAFPKVRTVLQHLVRLPEPLIHLCLDYFSVQDNLNPLSWYV